jgi:hypothetical protein
MSDTRSEAGVRKLVSITVKCALDPRLAAVGVNQPVGY